MITNGKITQNAKDKIYETHKNTNVKFIWDEKLVDLIDEHYPEFWINMDKNIALYLSATTNRIVALNTQYSLNEKTQDDFYIEQDVVHVKFETKNKKIRIKNDSPSKLSSVLLKERFVLVEAEMGYGK